MNERQRQEATDAASEPYVSDASRFFAEVKDPLVGALTIRTGNRSMAEDLAQEALTRAFADWSLVSAMANPRGWVYRVGFNLAASHWRRARSERRAQRRAAVHDRRDQSGGDLRSVDALVIRDAIHRLSRRQQEVIILRYFVRLDVAETAEALGIAEGTVKTQSHRALQRLRHQLGDDDDA